MKIWPRPALVLLMLLLGFISLNAMLAAAVKNVYPSVVALPPAPSAVSLRIQSLGDARFLFWSQTLRLHNLGTTGGRIVQIDDLDGQRIASWMTALQPLHPRSEVLANLAAYVYGGIVFGQDRNPANLRPMVMCLLDFGTAQTTGRWRWLATGAHMAYFGLGDGDLAMRFADSLSRSDPIIVPPWARNMNIAMLTAMGEKKMVCGLLTDFLARENLTAREEKWIRYLLERRCGAM